MSHGGGRSEANLLVSKKRNASIDDRNVGTNFRTDKGFGIEVAEHQEDCSQNHASNEQGRRKDCVEHSEMSVRRQKGAELISDRGGRR